MTTAVQGEKACSNNGGGDREKRGVGVEALEVSGEEWGWRWGSWSAVTSSLSMEIQLWRK